MTPRRLCTIRPAAAFVCRNAVCRLCNREQVSVTNVLLDLVPESWGKASMIRKDRVSGQARGPASAPDWLCGGTARPSPPRDGYQCQRREGRRRKLKAVQEEEHQADRRNRPANHEINRATTQPEFTAIYEKRGMLRL